MLDRATDLRNQELKQLRKLVGAKDRHIRSLNGLLNGRKPAIASVSRFEDVQLNEINARIAALDADDVVGHLELAARREDLKLQLGFGGRS